MAEHIIKNEKLTVVISTHGAEIQSIKSCDGKEFFWNGDASFWSQRSPLLFPICGGLKNDKYFHDGKEYTLPKHGFGRLSEFSVDEKSESEIVFLLRDSEKTLGNYPFNFELRVRYTLLDNSLRVEYSTLNTSDKTMYFSIGAHEGYLCSEGIEAFCVEFDKEEELNSWQLDGNLVKNETVNIMNGKKLPLKTEYFAIDALVFKDIKSRKVTLFGPDRSIEVEFDGFDYFLLWTKPNAPYICIEPWCGIPDGVDTDCILSQKEGIISLPSKSTDIRVHTITFNG